MQLVIDSELAPASNIGDFYRCPVMEDGVVQVQVRLDQQQKSNWCWAAIASALGAYYGTIKATQADIARTVLGPGGGEEAETAQGSATDQMCRLDKVLRAVGCFSHWSSGKPLFERVQYEINMGRPFGMRIGWHAGAAYYALIVGYRSDGGGLLVDDPLHGRGVYPMNHFPGRYREGGAWTETYWTAPSPKDRNPAERPIRTSRLIA